MLETVVPKSDGETVMVVLGEQRGQVSTSSSASVCILSPVKHLYVCFFLSQVGRVLQRDKNKCRAMVQLDRYEEKVFTLDYDTICHYVGGT